MFGRLKICVRTFLRWVRVSWQVLYGTWRISKLTKPTVTIFGGSRIMDTDRYFKAAHELGKRLVEGDISVLTGGGPGIMEAASCGAVIPQHGKSMIIGVGVTDLKEAANKCVQEYFELDYFFARKWLLTRFSSAFVVFPGGFGTLDELSEVLTLTQTKIMKRVPIVLFGVEYWKPFMSWFEKEVLKHGAISKDDFDLFTLTDDLEKVFCLIRDRCKATE